MDTGYDVLDGFYRSGFLPTGFGLSEGAYGHGYSPYYAGACDVNGRHALETRS